jgi:hypothetical protein
MTKLVERSRSSSGANSKHMTCGVYASMTTEIAADERRTALIARWIALRSIDSAEV